MGCGASSNAPPPISIIDSAEPPTQSSGLATAASSYAAASDVQLPYDALHTEPDSTPEQPSAGDGGLQISFAAPAGGTGKSIVKASTAGGDLAGSLKDGGSSFMHKVSFGALHEALKGQGRVTEAKFAEVLGRLLPAADAPPKEAITGLYRAFDADASGEVDEAELIAGCQKLCSGEEAVKLQLAFACFDKDGDGHLDKDELKALLKGTIEPAVANLHAAIDFASFGGEEVDVDAINEEARGAAALSNEGVPDGMVRVVLKTKVGEASLLAPKAAFASDQLDGSALSLSAFLDALVQGALDKHDADGNGTIESDEFMQFARENAFLSAWFGHLASSDATKLSWKDDFDAS